MAPSSSQPSQSDQIAARRQQRRHQAILDVLRATVAQPPPQAFVLIDSSFKPPPHFWEPVIDGIIAGGENADEIAAVFARLSSQLAAANDSGNPTNHEIYITTGTDEDDANMERLRDFASRTRHRTFQFSLPASLSRRNLVDIPAQDQANANATASQSSTNIGSEYGSFSTINLTQSNASADKDANKNAQLSRVRETKSQDQAANDQVNKMAGGSKKGKEKSVGGGDQLDPAALDQARVLVQQADYKADEAGKKVKEAAATATAGTTTEKKPKPTATLSDQLDEISEQLQLQDLAEDSERSQRLEEQLLSIAKTMSAQGKTLSANGRALSGRLNDLAHDFLEAKQIAEDRDEQIAEIDEKLAIMKGKFEYAHSQLQLAKSLASEAQGLGHGDVDVDAETETSGGEIKRAEKDKSDDESDEEDEDEEEDEDDGKEVEVSDKVKAMMAGMEKGIAMLLRWFKDQDVQDWDRKEIDWWLGTFQRVHNANIMSARPSGLIKRDLLAVVREFKNVEFDPKFNDLHELALIHGRVEELEMGLARAKQENEAKAQAKAQAQATYGWDDAHKLMETQERGGGASASSPKTKNRDKKGKGKKTDEDKDAHSHDGECFQCFLEKLGTRPEGLDALDALEKTLSVSEEQNGNHNGGNVKMTDLEPFLEAVGKSFPQLAESAAEGIKNLNDINSKPVADWTLNANPTELRASMARRGVFPDSYYANNRMAFPMTVVPVASTATATAAAAAPGGGGDGGAAPRLVRWMGPDGRLMEMENLCQCPACLEEARDELEEQQEQVE